MTEFDYKNEPSISVLRREAAPFSARENYRLLVCAERVCVSLFCVFWSVAMSCLKGVVRFVRWSILPTFSPHRVSDVGCNTVAEYNVRVLP